MSNQIVCPTCGSESVTRTRGIPSWHTCKNGHTYKADDAYTKVAWHKILRLTQELEASRQREAEARDKVLEEVIARFNALAREDLDRAERLEESDPEMATICREFAGGLVRAYAEVRALKAPAIGSQGGKQCS